MAKTIHLALLAGQCLFAGVVLFLGKQSAAGPANDNQFIIIAAVLCVVAFAVGNLVYKQVIAAAVNKQTLTEKMAGYMSALIVKFALIEGASLFSIVSFLLTGNYFFLGIAAVMVVYFFTLRPNLDKAAEELGLTYEEKLEIEN
ncbi:hypothetical protein EWM62_06410 [Mucilaginibacter terrigena]|uniref:Uncharacterized protein n=2 Tax=Mucilaginibacter terrigena TaxID=2492395 RepID=A0A4Q5LQE8_9SPHI|nr:hypothetical protein EWM62_06410 [Mucilaginibacter terrigena]